MKYLHILPIDAWKRIGAASIKGANGSNISVSHPAPHTTMIRVQGHGSAAYHHGGTVINIGGVDKAAFLRQLAYEVAFLISDPKGGDGAFICLDCGEVKRVRWNANPDVPRTCNKCRATMRMYRFTWFERLKARFFVMRLRRQAVRTEANVREGWE